jgi:[acyl-carrier-protein] S-malonyltransferase
MDKVALVFPGQGSQVVGMGLDLYQGSHLAREVFEEADQALGFPLSRLCFEGPEEELRQTINAQPAIMAVSMACLKVAAELDSWSQPSFVAGHSLGEYTALVAAGVLPFTDAIRLVRERGRLMHEAGLVMPGGMVAIMGLDWDLLERLCRKTGVQIANINSPNQIVLSGEVAALGRAMELAEARGARAIPLNVSGAFHSRLMESAAQELTRTISQLEFRAPQVPIVINTTAQPVTTANALREELPRQIYHCIHWMHSVEYMIKSGVSTFIELGPGRVLSGLIKKIDKGSRVLSMSDMTSIRAMALQGAGG